MDGGNGFRRALVRPRCVLFGKLDGSSQVSQQKTTGEDWKRYKDEVLSRLTPEMVYGNIKRQKSCGNGWVMGLCPLHNDREPSFAYHKETLRFVCFAGCGKGSAFDFLMLTSGTDFYHTMTSVGDSVGVERPVPEEKRPPIKEELVKAWHRNLWQNEDIVRWLRESADFRMKP